MADNKLIIKNLISTYSEIYRSDTFNRFKKYIQQTESQHLLDSVTGNDFEELKRLIKLTVIIQALAIKANDPKWILSIARSRLLDHYLKQNPELQTVFVDFKNAIEFEFNEEDAIWDKFLADTSNQADTNHLQTILIDKFKTISDSNEFKKFESYIKRSESSSLLESHRSNSKEELKRLIKLNVIVQALVLKKNDPKWILSIARNRLLDHYLKENPELQTVFVDFNKAIEFESNEEDAIWDNFLADNKNQADTDNLQTILIDKFKTISDSNEFKKFEPYIKQSESVSLLERHKDDSKEELKRLIKLTTIVEALAMKADNPQWDLSIARSRRLDHHLSQNPGLQAIFIDFKKAIEFEWREEDPIWSKYVASMQKINHAVNNTLEQQRSVAEDQHGTQEKEDSSKKKSV